MVAKPDSKSVHGLAWAGRAWPGLVGLAWPARPRQAWLGQARPGQAMTSFSSTTVGAVCKSGFPGKGSGRDVEGGTFENL